MSRTTIHKQKGKFNEFVKGVPCPLRYNLASWDWEQIRSWQGPFGKFIQHADRHNNDISDFKQQRIKTKLKDLDQDFEQQLENYWQSKSSD